MSNDDHHSNFLERDREQPKSRRIKADAAGDFGRVTTVGLDERVAHVNIEKSLWRREGVRVHDVAEMARQRFCGRRAGKRLTCPTPCAASRGSATSTNKEILR
jgi:hypothetical protein